MRLQGKRRKGEIISLKSIRRITKMMQRGKNYEEESIKRETKVNVKYVNI